ncbi:hypothetical protein BS78_04G058200 [Paspalum vaginatum]|nr:hypothetical protein BS78_04G058200 [Paspalum vaginatum]
MQHPGPGSPCCLLLAKPPPLLLLLPAATPSLSAAACASTGNSALTPPPRAGSPRAPSARAAAGPVATPRHLDPPPSGLLCLRFAAASWIHAAPPRRSCRPSTSPSPLCPFLIRR